MKLATLTAANPAFRNDLDRFFSDFCTPRMHQATNWLPRADILEDTEAHRIVLEIPGFGEEQVEVTIEDGLLTITGEQEKREEAKEVNYHRIERRHGNFKRTFRLPESTEVDEVRAEFRNGLLEVILPKSPKTKARTVTINQQ